MPRSSRKGGVRRSTRRILSRRCIRCCSSRTQVGAPSLPRLGPSRMPFVHCVHCSPFSPLLFSPPHPLFPLSLACASPLRLAAESRGGEDVERMLLRRGGGSAWRDGAVHEQGARGGGDGVLVVALVRVHAAVALVLLRERERERTKEKARAPQMRSGTIRERERKSSV